MLYYTRQGQGPTLVLLHYFGGSGQTWQPVIERLSQSFDCIAPDLRGWGRSQADYSFYSVDDMADDVEELLTHLGVICCALAGHSMGGKVAQALAARQGPGLTCLLLIAPSPLTPEPMTEQGRAALRASWGNTDQCRRTLGEIVTHPLPDTFAAQALRDNLRASQTAWAAWTDTGSREDLGERSTQITVPTFLLAGEDDRPLSPAYLQTAVADTIAGAALETLPGTRHLLPLEAPDAVAAFLRTHITPPPSPLP